MYLAFIADKAIRINALIVSLMASEADLQIYEKFYPDLDICTARLAADLYLTRLRDKTCPEYYSRQLEDLFSELFNGRRWMRESYFSEQIASEDSNIICIFDIRNPHKIIAAAIYRIKNIDECEIITIYVAIRYRRNGYASLMLLAIINHASLRRLKFINLTNDARYAPVPQNFSLKAKIMSIPEQGLYEKFGFVPNVEGDARDMRLMLVQSGIEKLFSSKGLVRRNSSSNFETLKQHYQDKLPLRFIAKEMKVYGEKGYIF